MKPVFRKKRRKLITARIGKIFGAALLVFLVLNFATYLFYSHRTYPNTRIGSASIGSVATANVEQLLPTAAPLPKQFPLSYQGMANTIDTAKLGVTPDYAATAQHVTDSRYWLPIANFLTRHNVPVRLHVDQAAFQNEVSTITKSYQRDAVDAAIVVQNGTFTIKSEVPGRALSIDAAKRSIVAGLGAGNSVIELPVQTIAPKVTQASLQSELKALTTQQHTTITLHYEGKSRQFTATEVASWFVADKQSLTLSDTNIQTAIAAVGASYSIGVKNLPQAVAAAKDALNSHKNLDFTLIASPLVQRRYTYCIATKGVSESFVPGLEAKLASVYNDDRGWSLGGKILFTKADSGCDFTVWLSASALMPSFGAICDSVWSCTVSPNVVINFDRWVGASESWNKSNGSLEDYRVMVINHETGHWLGFGHSHCGGPGQSAPVMQQQSIDLEGCTFNPWPLPSEQAMLAQKL